MQRSPPCHHCQRSPPCHHCHMVAPHCLQPPSPEMSILKIPPRNICHSHKADRPTLKSVESIDCTCLMDTRYRLWTTRHCCKYLQGIPSSYSSRPPERSIPQHKPNMRRQRCYPPVSCTSQQSTSTAGRRLGNRRQSCIHSSLPDESSWKSEQQSKSDYIEALNKKKKGMLFRPLLTYRYNCKSDNSRFDIVG